MNKKFIIFTGGTGGHVIPSVNLGNYLINKNYNCTIVTDKRGKKYTYNFNGKVKIISSSHLSGNAKFKLLALIKLIYSFFQSFIIIIKIKPNYAFSFGSYASLVPSIVVILLKFFFKTKYYIHEQNAAMGLSNKILIIFADKIFLNFNIRDNFKSNIKIFNKTHVVGLPNKEYNNRLNFNKTNKSFNLFVYGGSQGSIPLLIFLEKLISVMDAKSIDMINFIVQSPNNYKNNILKTLKDYSCQYQLSEFFIDIDKILLTSNLIISRSGAGTIDDIIRYKIPSILMPIPSSKNNHQYRNAKILSNNDCVVIIEENNINIDKALNFVIKMLKNNVSTNFEKEFKNINYPDSNKLVFDIIKND